MTTKRNKSNLLNEGQIRRMMGLAGIPAVNEGEFIDSYRKQYVEAEEEEAPVEEPAEEPAMDAAAEEPVEGEPAMDAAARTSPARRLHALPGARRHPCRRRARLSGRPAYGLGLAGDRGVWRTARGRVVRVH